MTTLTKFSNCITAAIEKETADIAVSGSPKHTAWPHFVGDNGNFRSGVWESTAGVFRGPMNDQIEFCHIIEGEARIVTENDEEFNVRAGDGFVMDNGLQPVWHVDKYVKKHFVIVSTSSQT
ncbi:MAG: DUF861 domain-containing protein [Gammaproteobacteria bacterium]|nr:DUF861 domain-containing protein [Gammaproteobacteria bacterium]